MGYIYNFSLQLLCIIVLWFSIVKKRELCAKNYKSLGNSLYVFFGVVLAYSLYTGFGGDDQRYRDFVEGGYVGYYYSDYFVFEKLYVLIAEKTGQKKTLVFQGKNLYRVKTFEASFL